ncbi:hypothetical protein [Niabella sp.]|uniref:hypothetical protein n=1 Tax=Niabella sp. TaxID=1962976 RepID=UPI00260FA327|nr:hypothetical protein [Niabella sp.]
MSEEKTKDLLDYLESLGFKDPSFEDQIRMAFHRRSQPFDLEHTVHFGMEAIMFRLEFWWDHQFNAFKFVRYRAVYKSAPDAEEIYKEYGPLAGGIYHVNSVYHDLSGRMENLYERFQQMDLEAFTGIELYWELQEQLAHNPDKFEIKCFRDTPEGHIEFIVPVEKVNGNYELNTYSATLTPLPSIDHGVFSGIDTLALEVLMREIDWQNDRKLFVFSDESGPVFTSKVEEVQKQIYELTLNRSPGGAHIADLLALKYWRNATFFEDQVEQSAWEFEKALPERSQNFPVTLNSKAAFNALCGRAVYQTRPYPLYVEKPAWVRFDFSAVGPNGSYICEVISGFSIDALKEEIRYLPIHKDSFDRIADELLMGDQVKITLPDGKKLHLEAYPEGKTINVYADNLKPIMVNLHFDPDWKPRQSGEAKQEILKRTPRKTPITKEDSSQNNRKSRRR